MYPLNTAHAQSVAKSCLMKIHFVLFQNTSALPASNNHSAITLSWLRGEQDTKGLFVGGCVAFLSPSSCSVKFSVSLKISLYLSSLQGASPAPSWCSAGWMGSSLSLWAAAILVPWPLLPAQNPAEDQDGVEEGGHTVWWFCCKRLWQDLPLELRWSCHRSWSHGPPALPVFSLYEREAVE